MTDPAIHTLMGMYDLLPSTDPACAKVWDFIADPPPAAAKTTVSARVGEEQPRWMALPSGTALAEGTATVAAVEGARILCARVNGTIYAATAVCEVHGTDMTGGRLSGFSSWICPAGPGCVYDVRDGTRLGGGPGLVCHPVREAADRADARVGLGMPFTPHLPAF